MNLIWIEIKRD